MVYYGNSFPIKNRTMANYFSDHPEIGFYLNHPLMARIVELKEKGFADAKEYDYAQVDGGVIVFFR